MSAVTRRAVFAAVPALAALPAVASGSPAASRGMSARVAAVFAQWRAHKEAGDNALAAAKRLETAIATRAGIVRPGSGSDVNVWNAYFAEMKAQPGYAETDRLAKLAGEQWKISWRCADEIVLIRPETLGDIVAQIDALTEAGSQRDLNGEMTGIEATGANAAYLRRLPDEIRRLTGV